MYFSDKHKPYLEREHISEFSLGNISFVQHHVFPFQHYAAITIEASMPLSHLCNYNIISPYKYLYYHYSSKLTVLTSI